MNKLLAFLCMLLLIGEMFHGSNSARAVISYPYFRHRRYPITEKLRLPLIVVHDAPGTALVRFSFHFHQFQNYS